MRDRCDKLARCRQKSLQIKVITWLFVLMTHSVEMSLLMLQLSLCVLTVIQVTSSQFRSNVTQYQLQRYLDQINAASAGKYSYSRV